VPSLDTATGLLFAAILFAVAIFYARRQQATLQQVRFDAGMPKDQRRYLLKQSWRRMFGSLLLVVLAGMLVGSLFLDWEPLADGVDEAAAKQSVHFLVAYVLAMFLIWMMILLVAVIDFWATARFGVEQRKQLVQEHQELLAAELAQFRNRRADMN
jgi:hypothetical protein